MPAGDQSFPKSARLRSRSSYLLLNRQGRRLTSPHFVFLWKPNQLSHGRLGITVTRKVGNAATRNRIKRLVRQSYRTIGPMRLLAVDLVVIAKKQAVSTDQDTVSLELSGALGRIARALPAGSRA